MDTRIVATFLLLIGLVLGLKYTQPINSTHLLQKSQLDEVSDILTQKYAESSQLKLPEFTSLWTNLLAINFCQSIIGISLQQNFRSISHLPADK